MHEDSKQVVESPDHSDSNAVSTEVQSAQAEVPHIYPDKEVPLIHTEKEAKPSTLKRPTIRKKVAVFILFIYTQIVSNFDSGAMGVVTGKQGEIAKEFHCNDSMIGLLASIVYLGNMAGGTFSTYLMHKYAIKLVICGALFLHILFTFLFASSPYLHDLILARFCVGFTQAFVVVYTPVWVDEFSPKLHSTLWLALAQAGTPVGIMLGYIIAGFIIANTMYSWRWIYVLKLALLLPSLFLFSIVKKDVLCIPKSAEDHADHAQAQIKGTLTRRNIVLLLSNPLYTATVVALCSVYFVVTTLQLWVTPYLRQPPIEADMNVIVSAFGFTSATAPVSGVIIGGMLLDRIGGYRKHPDRTAYMGMFAGLIAVSCALSSLFTRGLWPFMTFIWFLLFFGGSIVPCATGLVMASVPKNLRSAGSSLAAISYSLFGYFLGPLLCGFLAQGMGLEWGFRVSMLWAIVAFFAMGFATRAACLLKRSGGTTSPKASHPVEKASTDAAVTFSQSGTSQATIARDQMCDIHGEPMVSTPRGSNLSAVDMAMGILENLRM
ncbi:transporter protein [Perkinsela sp. CCAP 1560/4]|nr:transporter protein [Perkinsela sp. CCAP 1560/4]|eukprot:KNH07486.1 transporter protein [Perkinsela sp. CCAP 1560/4]